MTKTTWSLLAGLGLLVCCVCAQPGPFVIQVPFYLLTGWALYPFRVSPDHDIDWFIIAGAFAILIVLTPGVLIAVRWHRRRRQATEAWRPAWTFAVNGAVLLAGLAGLALFGITRQAVEIAKSEERWVQGGIREASARIQSSNNMKQMGLAAQTFHDTYKHLPPGGTFDERGRGLHGWQTQLLPYVDQTPLFKQIDLTQPWNSPQNAPAMKQTVHCYLSPAVDTRNDADKYALSHYAANVHVLGPTPMKLADVTDGTSNTMLMGEVKDSLKPWGMSGNWRDPMLGVNASPDGFGSTHNRNIVQILMADGTVRTLRGDVSPAVLKAISTPRGGESVDWNELER